MNNPKPPKDTPGYYNSYPFFMAYAKTYLESKVVDSEVRMIDAIARALSYDEFYQAIDEYNPDLTIMETSTPSIENDLRVAEVIKSKGSEIALAGPHATVFANDLIKVPCVDYILQGEYEVGSYELYLTMKKKHIYQCRPVPHLDFIPLPHRDNSVLLYADGFGQDKFIAYPQLQIWTSRGCPFHCNFCLWRHTMTYGNYRKRCTQSVTHEIIRCLRAWPFHSVLLDDDTFNIGDEYTIAMSKAMGHIGIQWHAMVRPDTCSEKAFYEMITNGCVGLKIGVESFSQNGLDSIKKGYKKDELFDRVQTLMDMGFKVFLSMMDNIPGETDQDRQETQQILNYFVSRGASFQHPSYMPLPGTEIYKNLDTDNKLDKSDLTKFGVFYGNDTRVIKDRATVSIV